MLKDTVHDASFHSGNRESGTQLAEGLIGRTVSELNEEQIANAQNSLHLMLRGYLPVSEKK